MDEGLILKEFKGKGEGVYTIRTFKKGEIVITGIIEKKLDKNHSHASQIGEDEYVFHSGLISKVNHSCEPNCGIRLNKTGAHDFVAMRDIADCEEVTFDYAMRNYGIDYFPKECMCGSECCRGTITGWKDLPDERKKTYKGFVAPYLYTLDKKTHANKFQESYS